MADISQESEGIQEETSTTTEAESETQQEDTNGVKTEVSEVPKEKAEQKEKSSGGRKSSRFHPYSREKHAGVGDKKTVHRNRVFISNIPYDMKWQAIKDLMREKVGEVTYVELFKDAEGKSRVSVDHLLVVEFKDEEFVKKAIEVMNKHDLNGRPLNIKEDPDGEHARRVLQRTGGMHTSGRGQDVGPGAVNLPPSIANNPNIPLEVINALQTGRLGSTVFVANLDFKVGWKKLKEVFSMAGTVKRADVKEDKDGKSRGMGTVTFEQPLEAVQAISMFNGQMLFDRPMHVKMDDKSVPSDDFRPVEKSPQLPSGCLILPFSYVAILYLVNLLNISVSAKHYTIIGIKFCVLFPSDMYRSGVVGMDRDLGRNDMPMNRGFGESFGGMGSGMGNMGMDRVGSTYERMSGGMDVSRGYGGHMGAGMSDRGLGSKGGCQIFVRNLSYDVTWQKLKEKFSHCGQVMFAEIKMENGKSKGCGTVRFDSPESAEQACRMMNGTKINGREIDVRIDRNA
uniref:Myelin expression factor 2 n=1 Tax=Scleropages formosus TaxID=113540 RepID=A0A8C9VL71_SCLFO